MASRAATSTAFLLLLNLVLFTMVSSTYVPYPPPPESCSLDTLKLGVCANILNPLVRIVLGEPLKTPCCTLIQGLVDLEAAVCLCTAIKANVLGINLDVPVSLTFLLNYCGKNCPTGFQCP